MNKLSIIGIFIFLTTVVTYSQSFKEEFVKAATFMENENFYSITVDANQLCPPYPSCIEDYVGEQDTSNCD